MARANVVSLMLDALALHFDDGKGALVAGDPVAQKRRWRINSESGR
jgi:hypothetical protein